MAFARDLVKFDPYPSATALLSVHSAIALNDAVLTVLTGSPYKGQDHAQAVAKVRSSCAAQKLESDGIRHLEKLIKRKTAISYEDRETTKDEADKLQSDSERFETWAFKLLQSRGIKVREL